MKRAAKEVKFLGRSPSKRLKGSGGFDDPIALDNDYEYDDGASVATEPEDLEVLSEEADVLAKYAEQRARLERHADSHITEEALIAAGF